VFYFGNGGDEEVFLGSADLMPAKPQRTRRGALPVTDPRLRQLSWREEILGEYLADTVKARVMNADGTVRARRSGSETRPVNAQAWFLRERATPRLG
jgi:polyphosphate kinase